MKSARASHPIFLALALSAFTAACVPPVSTQEPASNTAVVSDGKAAPVVPPVVKTNIALPVEVLFPNTGTINVPFVISDTSIASAEVNFNFRIFVETEDIGYIKVNGYSFRLKNDELTFAQPIKKAFGGLGSGYSVFELSKKIPAGILRPGNNQLSFVKDKYSNVHLGYRILDLNFTRVGNTTNLIANDGFSQTNPQNMVGLDTSAKTIAAGKALWSGAGLVKAPLEKTALRAHCSDCHVSTGYDLNYFGYSNKAIIQRSMFHGLTEADGRKVASYIRSLKTPATGRPWNPPYQPGPGLSAKPVNEWAAGAGAQAILAKDSDALAFAFPRGIPKAYDFKSARLDLTDVPTALELPVWNQWLPRIHPTEDDSFGTDLLYTRFYQNITTYSSSFNASEIGQLAGLKKFMRYYGDIMTNYVSEVEMNPSMSARIHRNSKADYLEGASEKEDIAAYSMRQWMLVKFWEGSQLNNLEGLGKELGKSDPQYPKDMPARAFYSGNSFQIAPHKVKTQHITASTPAGSGNGLRDPKANDINWSYFSLSWYYLQMLLWDNFEQGDGFTHWPYMTAFSTLASDKTAEKYDFPAVRMLTTLKSVEAYSLHAPGGERDRVGFNNSNGYLKFLSEKFRGKITQIDPATKTNLTNSILGGFTNLASTYPANTLNKLNIYEDSQCATKMHVHSDAGCTGSNLYWLVFEWRSSGTVDKAILNRLIDTYSKVWPGFDWECSRQEKPASVCLTQNQNRGVVF